MGYTIWPDGPTGEAVEAVYKERQRQWQLKSDGKFNWTCDDTKVPDEKKLVVLAEEFGEVSREVMEGIIAADKRKKPDPEYRERLRKELIQVAAVAVAWAESLA